MAKLWIVTAGYNVSKSAKNQPAHLRPKIFGIDPGSNDWPVSYPDHPIPLRRRGDVWNDVAHYLGIYATEAEAHNAAESF